MQVAQIVLSFQRTFKKGSTARRRPSPPFILDNRFYQE
jgi:hypothetical protein